MAPLTGDGCPLCADDAGDDVAHIDYDEVWTALSDRWGASFTDATRATNTPPGGTAVLRRCRTCGLEYARPVQPGDHRFYEEFDAAGYYEDDRWEFGPVAATITGDDDVIDVGCGRGAFLRRLPSGTGRRLGLDHNERAVAALQGAGLEARADDLATIAADGVRVDVVTAFHVVEHLAHVDELVVPALAVLRPGGRLVVSVPNRRRLSLEPFEVLDNPPHHVSRWGPAQLRYLADRHGLTVEVLEAERLAARTAAHLAAHTALALGRRSTRWATDVPRWRELAERARIGFGLLLVARRGPDPGQGSQPTTAAGCASSHASNISTSHR